MATTLPAPVTLTIEGVRVVSELNEHGSECSRCPAFIWAEESVRTGVCHGCRSPGPQFVIREAGR